MDTRKRLLTDFPKDRVIGCRYEDDHGIDVGIITNVQIVNEDKYVKFANEHDDHAFGFRYDWGNWHINSDKNTMTVSIPMVDGYTIFNLNPAT